MIGAAQDARLARRLRHARAPLVAIVLLLAFRFWNLQIVRGEEFAALARDNYLQTERRRAPRGLVLDRDGRVLAESEPSFALLADTEGIAHLDRIGELPADEAERETIRRRAARGPAVVRSRLEFPEVAFFEARRRELPGVQVDFIPARSYPLGGATAHLLGYVGEVSEAQLLLEEFVAFGPGDLVGHAGVERVYNAVLSGSDGYLDQVVDSRQRVLVEGGLRRTAAVRGGTVRLSVSAAVQEVAHRAFGDASGAFVALDVRTGEVLGLGSYPAHDPAEFRGDRELFRAMNRDPRTPLLNRAVQGRYPPGSAFKLVTAAAALAEGVADEHTELDCRGQARVAGRTFRCHRESGHGRLNLIQALAESCNVFFYRLAEALEVDVIARYARAFGLGERTGVDLLHEAEGLVPTREWKRRVFGERWYDSETASVSVGQGAVAVTPIQMARLAAAVASSGRLHTPRLMEPVPPEQVEPVAPEHYELIRAGMREAVESGTAWRAGVAGVEVAGKTGTAQVASADAVAEENEDRPFELRTHAWFVGFAPRDEPAVAVAVIVEHGGGGGAAAAPIGGAILEAFRDAGFLAQEPAAGVAGGS